MQSAHLQTTEIKNPNGWDAKSLRSGAGKVLPCEGSHSSY